MCWDLKASNVKFRALKGARWRTCTPQSYCCVCRLYSTNTFTRDIYKAWKGEIENELITAVCVVFLKKNLNAPRPSEHPPVRGKKCQNV